MASRVRCVMMMSGVWVPLSPSAGVPGPHDSVPASRTGRHPALHPGTQVYQDRQSFGAQQTADGTGGRAAVHPVW